MKVLVLSGYGINCEDETLNAFKTVGIKGDIIHVNDGDDFQINGIVLAVFREYPQR